MKRGQVHEHKVPRARVIDVIQRPVHAVDVGRNSRVPILRIGQEPLIADVVGADPDSVHSGLGWRSLGCAIREVSRDFVLQHRRVWNLG